MLLAVEGGAGRRPARKSDGVLGALVGLLRVLEEAGDGDSGAFEGAELGAEGGCGHCREGPVGEGAADGFEHALELHAEAVGVEAVLGGQVALVEGEDAEEDEDGGGGADDAGAVAVALLDGGRHVDLEERGVLGSQDAVGAEAALEVFDVAAGHVPKVLGDGEERLVERGLEDVGVDDEIVAQTQRLEKERQHRGFADKRWWGRRLASRTARPSACHRGGEEAPHDKGLAAGGDFEANPLAADTMEISSISRSARPSRRPCRNHCRIWVPTSVYDFVFDQQGEPRVGRGVGARGDGARHVGASGRPAAGAARCGCRRGNFVGGARAIVLGVGVVFTALPKTLGVLWKELWSPPPGKEEEEEEERGSLVEFIGILRRS